MEFHVEGMTCGGCARSVTKAIELVDPQASVKVVWLNAWFDPPRERDAAMTLMNQGADVLAFHTGSSAVMAAAPAAT